MPETNLIEVYRAANAIEAHLLRGELEAAGIRAVITDETVSTFNYPGTWWSAPRILVDEVDAAKAVALIEVHTK
jgi:hypothetical protein